MRGSRALRDALRSKRNVYRVEGPFPVGPLGVWRIVCGGIVVAGSYTREAARRRAGLLNRSGRPGVRQLGA
jgi:hypothetical protein